MGISNPVKGDAGFTLLELLIAVTLLSVGFLATFTVIWMSNQAGSSSRNTTSAAAFGTDVLEQLALRNYTGLKTGTYSYAGTIPAPPSFSCNYAIQQDVPSINMKTITVNVSWNEQGKPKSRALTMVRRADF